MVPFRIKICGITRLEDALVAIEAGADAIGLNFYPPSPRSIDIEQAAHILRHVRQRYAPANCRIFGVFVNPTAGQIADCQDQLWQTSGSALDGIQLHGDESIRDWLSLRQTLTTENSGGPQVIKALRWGDDKQGGKAQEMTKVANQIGDWRDSGINGILVDAAAAGEFGGTGKTIDWDGVRQLQEKLLVSLVLAGGLNPENVAMAIATSRVGSVDVASGVESGPGVKDTAKLQRFVENALSALATP